MHSLSERIPKVEHDPKSGYSHSFSPTLQSTYVVHIFFGYNSLVIVWYPIKTLQSLPILASSVTLKQMQLKMCLFLLHVIRFLSVYTVYTPRYIYGTLNS